MTALEELQAVTERERAALCAGDWRSLQLCVEAKLQLAETVQDLAPGDLPRAELRRLAEATRHNQALAAALSQQLSSLLATRGERPTYGRRGQRQGRPLAVVSLHG